MLSSSIASTRAALAGHRLRRLTCWTLAFAVTGVAAAAACGEEPPPDARATWQRMPPAPSALRGLVLTSVWTGSRYIVLGQPGSGGPSAAASYDPVANRWRALSSPGKTALYPGRRAVWTGKKMVVMNAFTTDIYDPRSDRWTELRRGHGGITAWTGREVIAWGGGCCGEARSDGIAFNPETGRWRALPRSPLAGSQGPAGAWTGRELLVFVGDDDPGTGKPWPARLARAAAFNPTTNTWRRIARPPEDRWGASTAWDGRELLVVGGRVGAHVPRKLKRGGLGYNPATNRWRRLAPMPAGRDDAAAAWTGSRLVVWGGGRRGGRSSRQTFAYDPATDRWSTLPPAPIQGRRGAVAVWTGAELLIWRGYFGFDETGLLDGAVLRFATP